MRWITLSSASCVCLDWIDHWSSTLDYELSHLWYSHTTHMSMFNECHIHSCNCTWLNVFSHALSLVIYHKKIFECFSCFWKILCFSKNYQNFQKFCPVLATQSRVEPVTCPDRESITEIFCDSLATHWWVNASVVKKTWYIFQNLDFHAFRGSGWWLVREWKVQSWGVHKDFHGSVRDSLTSGTSSHEKHLENFPKFSS